MITGKNNCNETKLLLIRHGESEANRQRIFAGHLNVALVDRGIKQAEFAAGYIQKNYKIDKIYSSDLLRAYQTAECISKVTGIEIIQDPQLREIFAGSWEGNKLDRLIELFPEDFHVWNTDIGKTNCTNGESVKELGERIYNALSKIAKENIGKTVVVVTHATPIRVAETLFAKGCLDYMKDVPFVSNASLTEVIWKEAKFQLVVVGIDDYISEIRTNSLA